MSRQCMYLFFDAPQNNQLNGHRRVSFAALSLRIPDGANFLQTDLRGRERVLFDI